MYIEKVREILNWYSGKNPGTLRNFARMFFNHGRLFGTGKMVNLPVDQGFKHNLYSFAPKPDGYNSEYNSFQLDIDVGSNAYSTSHFLIENDYGIFLSHKSVKDSWVAEQMAKRIENYGKKHRIKVSVFLFENIDGGYDDIPKLIKKYP